MLSKNNKKRYLNLLSGLTELRAGHDPAFFYFCYVQIIILIINLNIMKIHCICHEVYEDIGFINEWIKTGEHEISYTHVFLNEEFPTKAEFDFLIIMGGSASVYETLKYPWVKDEIRFIKKVIASNKKVLGICLGAQIIANALGANVYKADKKEIGWFPVKFNTSNLPSMSFLPEEITTFHWHGDTFDLPQGAVQLASSRQTFMQGFIVGENTLALQFHPEMTTESLELIIEATGYQSMLKSENVQTVKQITDGYNFISTNNNLMIEFLNFLTK